MVEQQQKALIVGVGKTGLSCARYLAAHGYALAFVDSRKQPVSLPELERLYPDAEVHTGGFDITYLTGVNLLVLSPGVDPREPMIQAAYAQGMDVAGDIELFAREVRQPVVAITGSNGKSTVTELVGAMAKAAGIKTAVGGNLGTPALDLLEEHAQLYVMELSSFQLETVRNLHAKAAVVLNVSEDHLDRYDSYADYVEAKSHIYDHAQTSVVNLDDPLVMAMALHGEVKTFTVMAEPLPGQYGLRKRGAELWLAHGMDFLLPVSEMKMQGRHNFANALAALALGDALELPRHAMLDTLREFPGLAHRTQWIADHNAVTFINDSKATNVGATTAAVQGIDQKLVLILGGVGKDQNFAPLRQILKDKVRHVVLIGRDADMLEQAINFAVPTSKALTMSDAVNQSVEQAEVGDAVLLSPACASFDMYSGYVERGNDFIACVQAATNKQGAQA